MVIRGVVGLRNVGKFLQKFFENQRLFQWLFVKRTKISDKNLNIWNFSDFLKKLKIFVNKNTIKMKNIKMYPLSTTFFSDISATFWKIPAKMKMPTTSLASTHSVKKCQKIGRIWQFSPDFFPTNFKTWFIEPWYFEWNFV